jgi:uncharacterized protein YoxC
MSDDKYIGHKLEQILDEVKAVHELVADVATRGEFNRLEQKVDTLSDGMEVVKAAVKATNRDVADLGREVEEHKGLPVHVAHGRA